MSFYTALTGLNGAQTDIATISNNIANVGTTGFKQSRVQFGDIFATSPLQNATSAVGEGTIVKSIQQEFTQGSIQSSANTTDLAISGQGFFALKPSLTSTQTVYSRNGSFSVNSDRYMVDNQGQFLQVFPVNSDGSATSTDAASATNLQLPLNSGLPKATSAIQLGINLPAAATIIPSSSAYNVSNPYVFNKNDASTYNQSTSITIYDSLGNPTIATIYYVKTSNSTSTNPTNKWATHVYVGDKELNPSLISAKTAQGQTLYVNKFGQTTTDPTQAGNPNSRAFVALGASDPAFIAGQPSPLYYQDQQLNTASSTPASVVGAIQNLTGFDFGSTDANTVNIVTDPALYGTTHEANPQTNTSTYWGTDMFTISVDGSTPQSISIKAGSYTGEKLAAELTRAVNAKFSDANSYRINDTYRAADGSVIAGNDVFNVNLTGTNALGATTALSPPLQIDLLGTAGSTGTPQVNGVPQQLNYRDLTQTQLIDLAQTKVNEQLNARASEFGKQAGWVDTNNPPIKVGYDVSKRALTFKVDPTQLGADATLPQNRYQAIQVFNPTSSTNDLGIPNQTTSKAASIGTSTPWVGQATLPSGPPLTQVSDQRNGISVTFNKNSRQFQFSSGTTGEASQIKVGRATLATANDVVPQISSYDLSHLTLKAGQTFNLESHGQSFTFIAPADVSPTATVTMSPSNDPTITPGAVGPITPEQLIADLRQALPVNFPPTVRNQAGATAQPEIQTITPGGNLLNGDEFNVNIVIQPAATNTTASQSVLLPTVTLNCNPTDSAAMRMQALKNQINASITAYGAANSITALPSVALSPDQISLVITYPNGYVSSLASIAQSVRGSDIGQTPIDMAPATITTSPTVTVLTGDSKTQEIQSTSFEPSQLNTSMQVNAGDQYLVSIPKSDGSVITKQVTVGAVAFGSNGLGELATALNATFGPNGLTGFSATGNNLTLTYPTGAVTGKFSISQFGVGNTTGGVTTTQTVNQGNIGPISIGSDGNGHMLVQGSPTGSPFSLNVLSGGVVLSEEPQGASKSQNGIEIGQALGQPTNSAAMFSGSNAILGIGVGAPTVTSIAGTGLPSAPASAIGATATQPMNQTFILNDSIGENQMTFTIDGITGSITLPDQAFTGDTLAAAIQTRINEIQDPTTGRVVSGATVKYDSTNNRLMFYSGTTGATSQFNVVGAANLGIESVKTVAGKVPQITTPTQAVDANQNPLYVDASGNITTVAPSTAAQAWAPLYLTPGELTFNSSGKLVSPSQGVVYSPFNPGNGANPLNLNVNYGVASTQYNQPFSVLSLQQDGFTSGQLNGLTIDASGTVRANYTNGQTQALGKIILANFANPNGLKQVGNSDYVSSSNSGTAVLGQGGSNGFGSIQSGALETSNVDITQELVTLITAQQNFQANSKVIETESKLTDKIIQIQG
jgi:flagellar hook protein FlgE